MINETFLNRARQVIQSKLHEAAAELGCLPPEMGTIHFSNDKFRFKIVIYENQKARQKELAEELPETNATKFNLPNIGICSLIKVNRIKAVIQCDKTKKRYLLRINAMSKYAIKQ